MVAHCSCGKPGCSTPNVDSVRVQLGAVVDKLEQKLTDRTNQNTRLIEANIRLDEVNTDLRTELGTARAGRLAVEKRVGRLLVETNALRSELVEERDRLKSAKNTIRNLTEVALNKAIEAKTPPFLPSIERAELVIKTFNHLKASGLGSFMNPDERGKLLAGLVIFITEKKP